MSLGSLSACESLTSITGSHSGNLAQVLSKQGDKAHAAALQQLPRNLRLMYVHAFQSYLWNAAATHRARIFGTDAAVEGDLVIVNSSEQAPAAPAAEDAGEVSGCCCLASCVR